MNTELVVVLDDGGVGISGVITITFVSRHVFQMSRSPVHILLLLLVVICARMIGLSCCTDKLPPSETKDVQYSLGYGIKAGILFRINIGGRSSDSSSTIIS